MGLPDPGSSADSAWSTPALKERAPVYDLEYASMISMSEGFAPGRMWLLTRLRDSPYGGQQNVPRLR